MAQQHIVPAVSVEISRTRQRPGGIARQSRHPATTRDGAATVHRVVVPATVRMAQQHIVAAITVEVARARRRPGGIARQSRNAAIARNVAATVHRVVVPATVRMAQQHVVATVSVEVARARQRPGGIARQGRNAAIARDMAAAVHAVVAPAAIRMAQQHIRTTISVEVADARHRPLQIACQIRRAPAFGHLPATVHRVVAPATVRMAQQHIRATVAIEVADASRQRRLAGGEQRPQNNERASPLAAPAPRSMRCNPNQRKHEPAPSQGESVVLER